MENYKKRIGMHLDPMIHQKLKAVADDEGRSMSEQVRVFIKDYIRKFEEKNGEIEIRFNEQHQK